MESFWNSSNLLKIFIKWKWHIISITFLGMAIIGASTYLIKPKFKSYAIVYPVNLGTFSEESFSEQMIQILNSRDITDKVMTKFNLSKHYEIDSTYKHLQSTLYSMYNENISISKTEFESVEINVLDTDPQIASDITNSIIDFYNEKVREMHRLKLKELMIINEKHANTWAVSKDSLQKRIHQLNEEYGFLDFSTQVEKLTEGIYRSNGNKSLIKKAEEQLNNIKKYGTEFTFINQKYWKSLDLYFQYKLALDQQKVEYQKEITYANIVTSPYASDKKYSPKRIPITMLGGLSVFALLILIIAFVENKKHNV